MTHSNGPNTDVPKSPDEDVPTPRTTSAPSEDAIQAFIAFARLIFARWEQLSKEGPPRFSTTGKPQYERHRFVFGEGGSRGLDHVFEQHYWILVARDREFANSCPEAKVCAELLYRDSALPFYLIKEETERPPEHRGIEHTVPGIVMYLVRLLTDILEDTNSYNPSDQQIVARLEGWINLPVPVAVHPRDIPVTVIVPLCGISGADENLCLGDMFTLEPLTPDRKTDIFDKIHAEILTISDLDLNALFKARFQLIARINRQTQWQSQAEIELVLRALRLLKSGTLGAATIITISETLGFQMGRQFAPASVVEDYELRHTDLQGFTLLYDSLKKTASGVGDSSLELPLRRFNQTYGRSTDEDRILDLATALENCLLRGDDTKDLSYKFRMRASALLAGKVQPARIFTFLNLLYDVRSKIVHEGMLLSDGKLRKRIESVHPADSFLSFAEDITRMVLVEFLVQVSRGKKVSQVVKDIDQTILLGMTGHTVA